MRIDVVFDVPAGNPYHEPTLAAIAHAADLVELEVSVNVVTTDTITTAYFDDLPSGIVIGPGSPYRAPDAAEHVIRTAREKGLPLVATWGGFQHVLVEHARSQIGIVDAVHAEYGEGGTPIVSLLSCSINGTDISVNLSPGSLLASLHDDADSVVEHTTCNYGLNRDVEQISAQGGMRPAGIDELGEVRAIERTDHPFFVATLYQPQLRSSPHSPHPIWVGFVNAAANQVRKERVVSSWALSAVDPPGLLTPCPADDQDDLGLTTSSHRPQ